MFSAKTISFLLFTFVLTGCSSVSFLRQVDPVSNVSFIRVNSTIFRITPGENEDFLVGVRNYILRFNSSLHLLDSTQNGPSVAWTYGELNKSVIDQNQDQDNKIILSFPLEDTQAKIIVCGTILQGSCWLYNYSFTPWRIGNGSNQVNLVSAKNALAIKVSGPEDNETALLVAQSSQFPSMSIRRLVHTENFTFFDYFEQSPGLKSFLHFVNDSLVNFVYAFQDGQFLYLLSNQEDLKTHEITSRLGRLCLGDFTLTTYTERKVLCHYKPNGANSYLHYTLATAAHFGDFEARIDTTNQRHIFIAYSLPERESRPEHPKYAVCSYSLEKFNDRLQNVTRTCLLEGRGQLHPFIYNSLYETNYDPNCKKQYDSTDRAPFCEPRNDNFYVFDNPYPYYARPHLLLDEEITSLTTFGQNGSTLALIGTSRGEVIKTVLSLDFARPDLAAIIFRQNFSSSDGANQDVQVKPGPAISNGEAFIAVSDRIIKFPLNSCSIYPRCFECIISQDPLGCGWCGTFCASSGECSYSVGRESCPPVIHSFGFSGPLQGGTRLTIAGDNFVKNETSVQLVLSGEPSIECVIEHIEYQRITCLLEISQSLNSSAEASIKITVNASYEPIHNYSISGEANSQNFLFLLPRVYSIKMKSDESTLDKNESALDFILDGLALNIGNERQVEISCNENASHSSHCDISFFDDSLLVCTPNVTLNCSQFDVAIHFDNYLFQKTFTLTQDPENTPFGNSGGTSSTTEERSIKVPRKCLAWTATIIILAFIVGILCCCSKRAKVLSGRLAHHLVLTPELNNSLKKVSIPGALFFRRQICHENPISGFGGFIQVQNRRDEVFIKPLCHIKSYEDLKSVLQDALAMKNYDHPNVLGLIGLVYSPVKVFLSIQPFMSKNLLNYVRDEDSGPLLLAKFTLDIASGMEYLSEMECVHQDLSARNCFLDNDLNV